MKYTVSLKENRDFKRLYSKGKTAAHPVLAVYCRRNGKKENRVGIAVSTKLGGAVVRNRAKRRLREAYRLSEERFLPGFDVVLVARGRTLSARFSEIEHALRQTAEKLGFLKDAPGRPPEKGAAGGNAPMEGPGGTLPDRKGGSPGKKGLSEKRDVAARSGGRS